ncbi:hypothetical protein R1sor_004721 [Riccia sorocarpa]|uniref:BAG domain-containing protein n=1 Tax=Riccia sorocarpa TaxID=122646 RepID=A0ABD3HLV3_9MARC
MASRLHRTREEAQQEISTIIAKIRRPNVETPIDKAIEDQQIVLTICAEVEMLLIEGLKDGNVRDQRDAMRKVHGKVNEMRHYMYSTIDELCWLTETSGGNETGVNDEAPLVEPRVRRLSELESAGSEYGTDNVPSDCGNSGPEQSSPLVRSTSSEDPSEDTSSLRLGSSIETMYSGSWKELAGDAGTP